MKQLLFALFLGSCFILSCRKDPVFVGIGEPAFIWTTEIPDLHATQPVLYKDKVYFSTIKGFDTTSFVVLDRHSGRKLSEIVTTPAFRTDWDYAYQYENGRYIVNRKGIHFFDLETATLKWTISEELYNFKGIDSLLFGVRNNQLLKVNLRTQTVQILQNLNSVGTFWNATAFYDVYKNEKAEICLATASVQDSLKSFIMVKNLNTNAIIASYEVPKLGLAGSFASSFKVFKNKLYYGDSRNLFCRDLVSGKLDWSKDYSLGANAIGTAAFFGTNELFIGPFGCTELVGLDLKTGQQLWAVLNDVNRVGFGSMEDFYYFNRTLYWGSGNLNAIDGATGKVLWSFNAEFSKPSFVFNSLPCGEGDKLYLASRSKAICIKAAQ